MNKLWLLGSIVMLIIISITFWRHREKQLTVPIITLSYVFAIYVLFNPYIQRYFVIYESILIWCFISSLHYLQIRKAFKLLAVVIVGIFPLLVTPYLDFGHQDYYQEVARKVTNYAKQQSTLPIIITPDLLPLSLYYPVELLVDSARITDDRCSILVKSYLDSGRQLMIVEASSSPTLLAEGTEILQEFKLENNWRYEEDKVQYVEKIIVSRIYADSCNN